MKWAVIMLALYASPASAFSANWCGLRVPCNAGVLAHCSTLAHTAVECLNAFPRARPVPRAARGAVIRRGAARDLGAASCALLALAGALLGGPTVALADTQATSSVGITYKLPPVKERANRCTFVSVRATSRTYTVRFFYVSGVRSRRWGRQTGRGTRNLIFGNATCLARAPPASIYRV